MTTTWRKLAAVCAVLLAALYIILAERGDKTGGMVMSPAEELSVHTMLYVVAGILGIWLLVSLLRIPFMLAQIITQSNEQRKDICHIRDQLTTIVRLLEAQTQIWQEATERQRKKQ